MESEQHLDLGIDMRFVQDNQSRSSRGVMRGLHFRNATHAQAKLIRVVNGAILDVVLDIRKEKKTFLANIIRLK
ncbi:MAG: dTDP-4-dehydrorhamnose 3,5-epimerase family protein [Cyclobacteriaceae bacterium]